MRKVLILLSSTVVLIVVCTWFMQFFLSLVIPAAVWILPFFFAGISLLSYTLLTRGALKSPHRFILGVNLSVLLKLLSSAIICAIYFALKLPHKITFAGAVMFNYVFFTIVMMRVLLKSVHHG